GLVLAALIVGAALLMRVPTNFQLFGYPGLAMICFLAAAAGGPGWYFQFSGRTTRAKRRAKGSASEARNANRQPSRNGGSADCAAAPPNAEAGALGILLDVGSTLTKAVLTSKSTQYGDASGSSRTRSLETFCPYLAVIYPCGGRINPNSLL